VAGERRADGDIGGFPVADFSHHDDVRVLAHNVAQARGEGQADLRVDVDLVDSRPFDTPPDSSMVMIFLSGRLMRFSAE